jgi:hypothetical protein
MHDRGQFKTLVLYHELTTWQSLQKPKIIVQSVWMRPYLIIGYAYPICIYLQKN